ncbi:MAG: PadR family transcriptional regulator [Firmicutes bacterium]|nr:PadR family transcriptional regulator [Bacillota bacterium]
MNSQFKKGVIEMCVINLISKQDMYGFEVIETLSKEIDVNENTIYPILRRLTNQGYFMTYMDTDSLKKIGAPRKYYKLTALGQTRNVEYENEWSKFLKGVFNILGGKTYEK